MEEVRPVGYLPFLMNSLPRQRLLHFILRHYGAELILLSCIGLWILRRPSQALVREAYPILGAVKPVFGIDVNAISAYSSGQQPLSCLYFSA